MATIGSILSIARSALTSQQAAISTVSHNVTNAETEGYSRQDPRLVTAYPVRSAYGPMGSGVSFAGVGRARDALLDNSYRTAQGNASGFGMQRDLMSQVELVFGEPSDTALASQLDAFWGSWSDLANDPNSGALRGAVRQRGIAVATKLNQMDSQLASLSTSTLQRVDGAVSEINTLTARIADLNRAIGSAEVGGATAGDLRDARDVAIDRLSQLGPISVAERSDHTVGVVMGNTLLVDAADSRPLETYQSGGKTGIRIAGGLELQDLNGELGGMLATVNDAIPSARAKLDALAGSIVTTVNGLHRTGYTNRGTTGVDFFVSSGTTAATIAVSAGTGGTPPNIAAGTGTGAYGSNDIALRLAALQTGGSVSYTDNGVTTTATFGDFYNGLVNDVALRSQAATDGAAAQEALASQLDTRRQSVSGVWTDEELIRLMRYQQAYAAATKLVKAADEMAQTILSMVN